MHFTKKTLISIAVAALVAVGAMAAWVNSRYAVPILTYHHVGEGSAPLNNVSAASFAQQMDFLHRHGYRVIPFSELVEIIEKGKSLPRRTVVIQFDDGFADNYTNAFPILKQHGFPATVFLISDSVGTPGFVTWDQAREMDAHGFRVGAHTRHHAYLPGVSPEQVKDEIIGSKRIIEENLGHRIEHFAYPSGGFTNAAKVIAKEAGFTAAVTTNRGWDKHNRDLYELKRIRVKDSDGTIALWAKLSGYYNVFRKCRHGGLPEGTQTVVND